VSERRVESAALRVSLLGRVAVRAPDGQEIRLIGRHAQALFTLLALTRRPRTREAIAADLWPDMATAATGPLRQALYQLRGALIAGGVEAEAVLECDAETLGLRPEALASLDVTEFEACATDPKCGPETAIVLYGGDLAEGLAHECFAAERERLADRFEDALATVATIRLAHGDHVGAREAAERLLLRDPLREEAHAVLIAVYGDHGSRSQVVRQYRRLCAVLARELGETPLPETDAAFRIALRRTVERSHELAAAMAADGTAPILVAVPG
jgi:DNA-binding SARP family transcriptional activator